MRITRRQLLWTTGALGLSALGFCSYSLTTDNALRNMGFIIGGGRGLDKSKEVFFLSVIDLDVPKPSPRFIPMDFLPHGLSFHPKNPFVLCVFEKKGPGACELDLSTGLIRAIKTHTSQYFYGHGAYLPGGDKLLSTETVLSTGEGLIVVRDAQSLQIEGQFPSYGVNPHDCKLIKNDTVIAITNGGASFGKNPLPSVTYVDIASQKLLEKFEIENPKFNTGHLAISNNLELAVSSAPRLGLPESNNGSISLLSNGKLLTIKNPVEIVSQLKAETLSLCIDNEREILGATSPAGNIVTFWKIKTGEFIKSITLKNPRGIVQSANNNYFIVSCAHSANLAFINSKSLSLEKTKSITRAGFSGSHLYSYATQT